MIRKLIIGNGRSEREILLVGGIVIGRDPACHVSEPDPLLSRRHAEIIATVHGVSVRDLNSRNGILVNGSKTREQVLLPGDVVQLGHLQIRYVEDRGADGRIGRPVDRRRQEPPAPSPSPANYDIDRFRPEPAPMPGRWRPEPTPLPGRRTSAPPPPAQPRAQAGPTPVPHGRAAFDETMAIPPGRGMEAFDQTMATPRHVHHDTTLGHMPEGLDATVIASRAPRDPSEVKGWPAATPPALGPVAPASGTTAIPGDATFASALAHLAGLASPGYEQVAPGLGAHLVANAELTVTDASPECADLLGIPDEQLIGDSLADVFLRAVRRAYAETDSALSLSIARGARGSITVTFTLDKTSGTE